MKSYFVRTLNMHVSYVVRTCSYFQKAQLKIISFSVTLWTSCMSTCPCLPISFLLLNYPKIYKKAIKTYKQLRFLYMMIEIPMNSYGFYTQPIINSYSSFAYGSGSKQHLHRRVSMYTRRTTPETTKSSLVLCGQGISRAPKII